MTLFKQKLAPDAPWYIHFEIDRVRHKKCLDTNVQRAALTRAKDYFDDVMDGTWEPRKPRRSGGTLADVLKVYRERSGCGKRTIRYNIWALTYILETCELPTDPEKVSLSDIDGPLIGKFQDAMVRDYVARARGENAKREAKELALRSSRSLISQARSIFKRKGSLRDAYAEAGITLPPSVEAFRTATRQGRSTKREYHAPPDSVVKDAFERIETLREADPDVYKSFWAAVGAGLRCSEVHRLQWDHFVDRDGRLWISGGIGKDGEVINVPLQKLAADKLTPLRKKSGKFLHNHGKATRRLNKWMRAHGWQTKKKMHELRAYVGSLIYRTSPTAAMAFMRHKSIRVTESFYVRYGTATQPVDVL